MQVPTVIVYVRHSADCQHKEQGELFKGCKCRKQVRWWKDGKLFRRSAKTRSWTQAEKVRSKIEASFAGDPTVQTGFTGTSDGKTIQQAIELFITNKRSQGVSQGVIGKYERELKDLESFFARHSKFHVRDITLDDLILFRGTWNEKYPSSLTRQKVQERLRSFLRYCYDSGSLQKLPKLSPIKVDEPPTLPLTDTEYTKLLSECTTKFNPDKAKKVHALVRVMRHSGLAIRDAVTLERDEILWDKKKKVHRIVTSRQKTGVHVSIPLPPDVAKELLEVLNGNERYVFWNRGAYGGNVSEKRGVNGQETTVVGMYQTALRDLFKAAGVYLENQHMVSHRLRDTFAVGMLEKGVPMEEVAKMLGNSLKVCEKHYAKWMQSRQDRLDSLVIGTWTQN
jgi:integrase/recombinase XerD